ncbi:MAG TPA: hypothetical protein PLB38_02430 [bacterium]|nr:hypothetical protein [bacterium]
MSVGKEFYDEQYGVFCEHLNMAMKSVCRMAIKRIKYERPDISDKEVQDMLVKMIFSANPTVICKKMLIELAVEGQNQA